MGTRKLIVTSGLLLATAMLLAAVAVFRAAPALGQPERPPEGQAEPGQRPPQFPPEGPGGFQLQPRPGGPAPFGLVGGGPVALAAQGDHVYVVRGNTLYQFAVKELRLVKKVALEEEPRFGPLGPPRKAPAGDRPRPKPKELEKERE